MKQVYASANYLIVGHLKQVLADNHIHCLVKNEHLMGAAGELPMFECWPELWITEDAQLARALEFVEAFLRDSSRDGPHWACPKCDENIEPQFSTCWNCGTEQPLA